MSNKNNFQMIPFPESRLPIVDYLSVAHSKHVVHLLTELDVSRAREYIRQYKAQTGDTLSFTAYIVHCLGHSVEQNRYLHAYRTFNGKLILFDDVDISTPIERNVAGHRVATPYIIRAANRKSFREIHHEIRDAQAVEKGPYRRMNGYRFLPAFLRRAFWHVIEWNPHWRKRLTGTVGITAVGMFGKGAGWGLPITGYTLQLTLGGIAEKPGVVDGQIEIREYLSLTISVDHDVVDGAPAARFASRLKERVENGEGLET